MLRSPGRRKVARRSAAITVGLLLAAAAIAPGARAVAATAAAPPPASDQQVLNALHIGPVPTEMVFLVDHSQSMGSGSYKEVETALTSYFTHFPSYDQVVVITFSDPNVYRATVDYGPGPAPADIGSYLPGNPAGGTDFGYAFSAALDQLDSPPPGIKAGGVVLLSDGQLNASMDPKYNGYSAPGWKVLKARATRLTQAGFPVTAYAIPLASGNQLVTGQVTALKQVFDPVESLTGAGDLATKLSQATADIKDGEVYGKVAGDSGKGVQATWSGLSGSGTPLDLGTADSTPVGLTLRAQTSKVPLYLTGLQVTSPGLPLTVTGLPDEVTLNPGKTVHIPLTLSWKASSGPMSLGGGTTLASGHLQLAATVDSSWSDALLDFHINDFSVGSVAGGTSAQITGLEPADDVLLPFVLLLLLLLAFVIAGTYAARLRGTLMVALVDDPLRPEAHRLPRLPLARINTERVLGADSRMTVFRWGRGMRVNVVHHNSRGTKLRGTVHLRPDGRATAAGLELAHRKDR